MFASEAIQVIEQSPARVVIVDPPFYSFGAWVLFLAALGLVAAAVLLSRNVLVPLGWASAVVGLVLLVFGSYLATGGRRITLSRDSGLLTIERTVWWLSRPQAQMRLVDIRRATVETLKYSHSLVVVMTDGKSYALGDGSNRQGYYGAADAINDYLGVGNK